MKDRCESLAGWSAVSVIAGGAAELMMWYQAARKGSEKGDLEVLRMARTLETRLRVVLSWTIEAGLRGGLCLSPMSACWRWKGATERRQNTSREDAKNAKTSSRLIPCLPEDIRLTADGGHKGYLHVCTIELFDRAREKSHRCSWHSYSYYSTLHPLGCMCSKRQIATINIRKTKV